MSRLETIDAFFYSRMFRTLQGLNDPVLAQQITLSPHLWPWLCVGGLGGFYIPDKTTDVSTNPYVNYGRWLTNCPFCKSTQHASDTDQWFFCASCLNANISGVSLTVAWPADQEEIEDTLLKLSLEHQNWVPD